MQWLDSINIAWSSLCLLCFAVGIFVGTVVTVYIFLRTTDNKQAEYLRRIANSTPTKDNNAPHGSKRW